MNYSKELFSIKTATLTFHAPNNNGSFLQAYALQHVLVNKFHIKNEIIDFYSPKQESQYAVFRLPRSGGDVLRNAISVAHYYKLKKRASRFTEMRNKYLSMTSRCKLESDVLKKIMDFDVIICGSDQIWNTEARDFSDVYLLSGIQKKKITYAVSCGSRLEAVDKNKIVNAAWAFDGLSVREQALYNYLNKRGLHDVKKVLDPTLLLNKSDYLPLYNKISLINGDYILLYTIDYNDEILQTVSQLAKEYNLPVFAPFTGYSAIRCLKYGIRVLYDVAPEEFLCLFENATHVCSNSFHGIAFSIIFEKNFFRLCNLDKNGLKIPDDRIDSLLDALCLWERNISINDCDIKNFENIINYSVISEKLTRLREPSYNYLQNVLRM